MINYKKILFPYAYNILGSSEDAKDAIQEVMTRYYTVRTSTVQDEKNYLIRGVINQAINQKRKNRKVVDQGVWLPEPVATEFADDNLKLSEILSYSLLVLLERLNPKERAVFILKEGFAYSHDEIAELLDITAESTRKSLSRSKKKLGSFQQERSFQRVTAPTSKAVFNSNATVPSGLLENYIAAIRERDLCKLRALLTQDITFFADGGGKVNVIMKTCQGPSPVAELLIHVHDLFQATYTAVTTWVNHQPALLYMEAGETKACQVFTVDERNGRIRRIDTIVAPDKLRNFS